jgi:hypothetical protein
MLSNRRCRVPEELYDYHNKLIKHPSVSALDLESGKWFSCKQCKSPRDKEGKFFCKTASGQNAGTIRYAEMKSHKDKQQQADLPQQDNMRVVWLTPSPHSSGCCDGGGGVDPPPLSPCRILLPWGGRPLPGHLELLLRGFYPPPLGNKA